MNFRNLLLATLTIFLSALLPAQTRISLLTCGPGDQTYSLFGHTALRVQDSLRGTDHVYNYGVFDFDTPNFTWKFMRGKLMYKLDIQTFRNFLEQYDYEKRSAWEQEVRLSEPDKAAVLAYLTDNYRPEKRYYPYDFFYDNCSSRTRDVFEKVLKDRLSYRFPESGPYPTYRDMIDPYILRNRWMDLGIDLLLGAPTDKPADERAQMFLPDFLSAYLAYGLVDGNRNLLGPRITLLDFPNENRTGKEFPTTLLLWLLLPLYLLSWRFFPKVKAFDIAFWIIAGLIGCLVAFMWFGTDHVATKWNWNILWLNPVQLLAGIALAVRPKARWLKAFGWAQFTIAVILVIGWRFLPFEIPGAALPLLLLVAFASGRIIKK